MILTKYSIFMTLTQILDHTVISQCMSFDTIKDEKLDKSVDSFGLKMKIYI